MLEQGGKVWVSHHQNVGKWMKMNFKLLMSTILVFPVDCLIFLSVFWNRCNMRPGDPPEHNFVHDSVSTALRMLAVQRNRFLTFIWKSRSKESDVRERLSLALLLSHSNRTACKDMYTRRESSNHCKVKSWIFQQVIIRTPLELKPT